MDVRQDVCVAGVDKLLLHHFSIAHGGAGEREKGGWGSSIMEGTEACAHS